MPTPSGAISFSSIQTEFGGTSPASMSEYTRNNVNVPIGQPVSSVDGNAIEWRASTATRVGTFRNLTKTAIGNTWTNRTGLGATTWGTSRTAFAIAWNGSVFCVVGDTGGCATSPDGITWTWRSGLGSLYTVNAQFRSIVWTGSVFVAGGVDGSTAAVATSSDGITWTKQNGITSTTLASISGMAAVGSNIVAVGGQGTTPRIAYSSNGGVTWTSSTLSNVNAGSAGGFNAVTVNGTNFCAIGSSANGILCATATSHSGTFTGNTNLNTAWTSTNLTSRGARSIAVLNGTMCAIGNANWVPAGGQARPIAATSTDNGATWTWQTGLFALTVSPTGLATTPSIFVPLGNLWTNMSPDGATWYAPSSAATGGTWYGGAWNGTRLVIVGTAGSCATSL